MREYLELARAKCKDCYKCLRGCPVKAIKLEKHQAKIIRDACVLCGRCALNCPQNAKHVVNDTQYVLNILKNNPMVIASVAPSFVSSFGIDSFQILIQALKKIGFYGAEETAIGARIVTDKYYELLKTHQYKNFITSACPSVNRLIQLYYPNALCYLAPVDSPMVAHGKMIKKVYPNAKVIFIGPCISKIREADESDGIIDGVLTFEELNQIFIERNIILTHEGIQEEENEINTARFYPISRGIIKSFHQFVEGYQYVAIDGLEKCKEALASIDQMEGMFFELNSCEHACINGPCILENKGGSIKANADIRKYVSQGLKTNRNEIRNVPINIDKTFISLAKKEPHFSEAEIRDVLLRTNKKTKADELNCGACGYNTCREKAIAVLKGLADIEMCVPFMKERAESMSNEIIKNSPFGIIVIDIDFKILDINQRAKDILGEQNVVGTEIFQYMDANEFVMAQAEHKNRFKRQLFISKTNKYIDLSVSLIPNQEVLFAMMEDVTEQTNYDKKIDTITMNTLSTTDEVIKKQMRVAQEIASLLGEVTAETKVALLKLKNTLLTEKKDK